MRTGPLMPFRSMGLPPSAVKPPCFSARFVPGLEKYLQAASVYLSMPLPASASLAEICLAAHGGACYCRAIVESA